MLLPFAASLAVFGSVYLLAGSAGPVWDRVSGRYMGTLRPMMEALSLDRKRIDAAFRLWGLALLIVPVVLGLILFKVPLALVAVFLLLVVPRMVLAGLIRQRMTLLRDQMVGATQALAAACRAGLSLPQALENVARETPQPLKTELSRIVRQYHHGLPLSEAITETAGRLKLESFTLFASAILVAIERGGRITDALERISRSLEENQRVERKLDSDTAQGRAVVWILAASPVAFLVLFGFLMPEGVQLMFDELLGQVLLAVMALLVWVSIWWSLKILSIEL